MRCPLLAVALLALVGSAAAVAAAVALPRRTVVLSGAAVGPVGFGQPQHQAVESLEKLLGESEGGVRRAAGNCTIDAALYWTNFAAYFFKGRFVGYQTGNNLTGNPEPAFNGETPQGLRVGDTLAHARTLYPGHVTTSAVNGGVYAITTATGTIRGYLSRELAHPAAAIKIVTIAAGSVGCPAASPG